MIANNVFWLRVIVNFYLEEGPDSVTNRSFGNARYLAVIARPGRGSYRIITECFSVPGHDILITQSIFLYQQCCCHRASGVIKLGRRDTWDSYARHLHGLKIREPKAVNYEDTPVGFRTETAIHVVDTDVLSLRSAFGALLELRYGGPKRLANGSLRGVYFYRAPCM